MAALDQHVGGHHQLGPRCRQHHRGVVADADLDPLAAVEPGGEPPDQPELADLGEGRVDPGRLAQVTAFTIASFRPGKPAR